MKDEMLFHFLLFACFLHDIANEHHHHSTITTLAQLARFT